MVKMLKRSFSSAYKKFITKTRKKALNVHLVIKLISQFEYHFKNLNKIYFDIFCTTTNQSNDLNLIYFSFFDLFTILYKKKAELIFMELFLIYFYQIVFGKIYVPNDSFHSRSF